MAWEGLVARCVGCGRPVPWDGRGVFAYTCPCGATIFVDDDGRMYFPASLVRVLAEGGKAPHIDYYLGRSNHTSETKEKLIDLLRGLGSIWSWECEECRNKVVSMTREEVREGLIRLDDLHPVLRRLVEGG